MLPGVKFPNVVCHDADDNDDVEDVIYGDCKSVIGKNWKLLFCEDCLLVDVTLDEM